MLISLGRLLVGNCMEMDEDFYSDGRESPLTYTQSGKIRRSTDLMEVAVVAKEKQYRTSHLLGNVLLEGNPYCDRLVCTSCGHWVKQHLRRGEEVPLHPFLKVFTCKACLEFYYSGAFSCDEEGEEKYCRWCGQGGDLYQCSKCNCAFCEECILRNLGEEKNDSVKADDDWECFFCNPRPLFQLRHITQVALDCSQRVREKNDHQRKKRLLELQKERKVESSKNRRNRKRSSSCSSEENSVRKRRRTRARQDVDSDSSKKAPSKRRKKLISTDSSDSDSHSVSDSDSSASLSYQSFDSNNSSIEDDNDNDGDDSWRCRRDVVKSQVLASDSSSWQISENDESSGGRGGEVTAGKSPGAQYDLVKLKKSMSDVARSAVAVKLLCNQYLNHRKFQNEHAPDEDETEAKGEMHYAFRATSKIASVLQLTVQRELKRLTQKNAADVKRRIEQECSRLRPLIYDLKYFAHVTCRSPKNQD